MRLSSPSACSSMLNAAGAVPGPMDAWLTLRGTKTLALRMKPARRQRSRRSPTGWPSKPRAPKRVFYPGLASAPPARTRQASDERLRRHVLGGDGFQGQCQHRRDAASRSSRSPNLWAAWRSLVCHPAGMTHASVEPARRAGDRHHRWSCSASLAASRIRAGPARGSSSKRSSRALR